LLVSRDGYPLAYDIFEGNKFDGSTMIPVIDAFRVLSGYMDAVESGQLYKHDLDKLDDYVPVPILKPDNIGSHMAIDEKHIDGEYYTILSNQQSGKIALLAQTTKALYITEILKPYESKRL